MSKPSISGDYGQVFQLIERLQQEKNTVELEGLVSKVKDLIPRTKETIYLHHTWDSMVDQTSPFASKWDEEYKEAGFLITRDPTADVGGIDSVYLLNSGRFLIVRNVFKKSREVGEGEVGEWRGSAEEGDDLTQMLRPEDLDRFLARLEKTMINLFPEKFEEKLDELLPSIGREEVGEIVKLLLRVGRAGPIYKMYGRYRNEIAPYLISAMKGGDFTERTTAITALGGLEVELLVQALDELVGDRRKLILEDLRIRSKALIPLLKAHKRSILAGRDPAPLEEAIHAIDILPWDLVKPLIKAIENDEVTLWLAISILGKFGARGNQHAIEYLTHLYLEDKNSARRKLAGDQLDKLGKCPKSWRGKVLGR